MVDLDGTFALRSAAQAVVAKGQVWHEFRLYTDLYLADLDGGPTAGSPTASGPPTRR